MTIYSLEVLLILFWSQSVVPCPVLTIVSWPAYRFLKRQVILWCLGNCKNIPFQFAIRNSLELYWSNWIYFCINRNRIHILCISQRHQFRSVARSYQILCNPMDCSTPGFPIHHQLLKPAQTPVHWVDDIIKSSHPLSSLSPPAFNLSQHQGLFQWVSSLHQVAKVLELQF